MLAILNQGQVGPPLKRIALATQSLLRDTIELDEEQWRSASLLPGWSRAHVATHIARNADALRRLIAASLSGDPAPLYPSASLKYNDIERGAERSGLDLHVDLDTAAGELARLMDRVEDWMVPVRLPAGEFPLSVVTLIRLQELILHHLDLNTDFSWQDVDPIPAGWLLEWTVLLMRDDPSLPAVDISSDAGVTASLGGVGERRAVSGPDAALWAWLTGRTDGDGLTWEVDGSSDADEDDELDSPAPITFPLAG
ncbi:maleylpyruvate isomerase family mycothiol-dependent enzyme [Propioniciclava coleopterorum]|uniref:Maleylpyruvate isomerase family mycothiol-dependent enzyme n=1 Tax=Propioniciclava coleopterorum TaxID=2714937 RepID=A0A6G7Y862_9ACTN|nr:maleylpyruvate isomerase family mycothiol-dependent enzyme [Propioniciclava coleopterorum]QIK72983.1 maleylpyruvate isomerase family mycothiol-dependent enzyme [Propioniciclava coleopterorum]